jgi:hypothetical protein
MSTEKWVQERADGYRRHGGKQNRRATTRVLVQILKDIKQHDGCVPGQIGRRQIIGYYKRQQPKLATATLRRHYAAISLLWVWLGRTGKPPRPERSVDNCPAHTPR